MSNKKMVNKTIQNQHGNDFVPGSRRIKPLVLYWLQNRQEVRVNGVWCWFRHLRQWV